MKILVFDDSEINRKAAQAQLKDHDLTVVGTYDEAQALLLPRIDSELQTEIFEKRYGERDAFKRGGGVTEPAPFVVEGSKMLLCNNRNWVNKFDPSDLGRGLGYDEYSKRSDTVRAKDWAALLAYLIA